MDRFTPCAIRWKFHLSGLVLLGTAVLGAASPRAALPPNVIVILADDLGYGTLGAYGLDGAHGTTPNLDRFMAEGVRFTDGYVTCSVCSPSRAGLITGQYQQRFGYYANVDANKGALPPSVKIFPQFLKPAGYVSAMIGKWNLGIREGQHPLERGFDEYFGFNSFQTDYFQSKILFNGREKVTEHEYLTFEFTKRAIDFARREKDRPFFLYLCYNAVHGPDQAPEALVSRFAGLKKSEAIQAAMVAALDQGVGQLMAALRSEGLDEDTLVFFLSDNGGLPTWWRGSNGPLQGYKREQWEGGERVPFAVRWPGHISPGRVERTPVSSLDLLPTAMAAAGVSATEGDVVDGVNLLPWLRGQSVHLAARTLYWAGSHIRVPAAEGKERTKESGPMDNPPPAWGIRRGPWKLMQIMREGEPKLFNLEADVSEMNDVAGDHPELVRELRTDFVKWLQIAREPIGWNRAYYDELKALH